MALDIDEKSTALRLRIFPFSYVESSLSDNGSATIIGTEYAFVRVLALLVFNLSNSVLFCVSN